MSASNEYDFVKKRLKMLARVETHNQAKIKYNQQNLTRIESIREMKQDKSSEVEHTLFRNKRSLK